MRTWLESTRPILVGLSAVTLVIVVLSGVLLSMWYVPSSEPLRTSNGTAQAIVTSTRLQRSGPYTDTIKASSLSSQLAPAAAGEPVVSAAQSSIRVSIHNAPHGTTIRRIHYWMSDILMALLTLLLVVLCLLRTYETDRSLWMRFVALTLIVVAGGWTGRILVDDVYAEISRRIMGHELSSAPLGDIISGILGIQPGALLLARTYSVHGFLIGVLGLLLITSDVREILRQASCPPYVFIALLIVLGVSYVSLPDWGVRDAVRGLAGWERVTPWWGIVPFRAWSQWLGSELAGYVALTLTGALISLPFWFDRMTRPTVSVFLFMLFVLLIMGLLFGN